MGCGASSHRVQGPSGSTGSEDSGEDTSFDADDQQPHHHRRRSPQRRRHRGQRYTARRARPRSGSPQTGGRLLDPNPDASAAEDGGGGPTAAAAAVSATGDAAPATGATPVPVPTIEVQELQSDQGSGVDELSGGVEEGEEEETTSVGSETPAHLEFDSLSSDMSVEEPDPHMATPACRRSGGGGGGGGAFFGASQGPPEGPPGLSTDPTQSVHSILFYSGSRSASHYDVPPGQSLT